MSFAERCGALGGGLSASCWALRWLGVKAFESIALAAAAGTFPARRGREGRQRCQGCAGSVPRGAALWASPLLIRAALGARTSVLGREEGSELSAESRPYLTFFLLPLIISALSGAGGKHPPKGRKMKVPFLGLHPLNVICQMASETAAGSDPRSPCPMLLSLVLSVYSGGPTWRRREM